jgi:hypothetical protein
MLYLVNAASVMSKGFRISLVWWYMHVIPALGRLRQRIASSRSTRVS